MVAKGIHTPEGEDSNEQRKARGQEEENRGGLSGPRFPPVWEDDVHEKTSDGPREGVKAEGEEDQGLEGSHLGCRARPLSPAGGGGRQRSQVTVTVGVRPSDPGSVRGKWREAEAAPLTSLESAS